MKSIYPRQIFLATACIFGAINFGTLPTMAQNSPSTPDSQLPPISPTTPNSPTTPTSSPQTPNSTITSPTTTPNSTDPNRNNPTQTDSQTRPTSPTQTTPSSGQRGNSSSLNTVDRQFATKAAQSDLNEIQTSQLALQRSQNPQILSYAREMIQAHTDSTNKLKPIAARLNLALPNSLAAEDRALVNQLSRLSGTQFDRAYMNGQTQGHAKTQALYQTQLQRGQNSQLKAFASEILPVVSMHLQMAKNMTAMR